MAKEFDVEKTNALIEDLLTKNVDQDTIFSTLSTETGLGLLASIRVYKKYLKESGRILSADQRKEITLELVEAGLSEGKITDLNKLVSAVSEKLMCSNTSALGNIKRVCAANEIEVPRREQGVTGEVNHYLVANPNITRDDFLTWMKEQGKTAGNAASYWAKFMFAKQCFKVWSAA